MTLKFLVISVSYNLENVCGGREGKVKTQGGQELRGFFTWKLLNGRCGKEEDCEPRAESWFLT